MPTSYKYLVVFALRHGEMKKMVRPEKASDRPRRRDWHGIGLVPLFSTLSAHIFAQYEGVSHEVGIPFLFFWPGVEYPRLVVVERRSSMWETAKDWAGWLLPSAEMRARSYLRLRESATRRWGACCREEEEERSPAFQRPCRPP